jgi:trigger factor
LKIETQTRDDHQVNLIVELEPDVQEKFMRRAARKISQSGKISGFRPGKAPYDVVKRTYGVEVIEEQAMELMIDDIYPKVLEEAGIEPSGAGKLDDTPSLKPPKFNFLVPLKPEISLTDFHSIRQAYQPEPINDEQVNVTLQRIQMNNAVATPVERGAETNDMVVGLVSATLVDHEQDDAVLYKDKPFEFVIDESDHDNSSVPFPGFLKVLIGLSSNEEKKVIHEFDENTESETLRGKKVEFSIKVQSVKELDLPDLNDDFAKSLGEYSTMEELKNSIHDEMEKYNLQSYDDDYFNRLIQTITEKSTVKYPPHMLEEEIQSVMQEVERNLAYRRLDLPAYLKTLDMDKETYIEKEIKPIAEKRLKQSLVMQEIIRNENITVERDELQSATYQTIGDVSKITARNLPRGTTKEDYLMAATYQTANVLLSQHLRDHLKSIASGEFEKDIEETKPEIPTKGKKSQVEKPSGTKKKTVSRKNTNPKNKTNPESIE